MPPPDYPPARRDQTVDVWHGELVADPYRWLEDTDSPETAAWVRAQNAVTRDVLGALPGREQIRGEVRRLLDVTRRGAPYRHGSRWFFTRREGLADQPVLVVADRPEAEGRVLLDPNRFSADGTVALTAWAVDPSGHRLAYARSDAGSDWMTWRVREVDTGNDLDDVVAWSKFCVAAWLGDGSGFVYGAYDPPRPGEELLDKRMSLRLQRHLLGRPQAADELVYLDPDPECTPEAFVTDDHRWLVVQTSRGTRRETAVRLLDLDDQAAGMQPLIPEPVADSRVVGNDGTTFYVLTNLHASRRRIVAIDLAHADPDDWREIVPESPDLLLDATLVGEDVIACHVLCDASSTLRLVRLDGTAGPEVRLPGLLSITEMSAGRDDSALHLATSSFVDPATTYRCDVRTGDVAVVHRAAIGEPDVVTERARATSADGTSVPMFLVHRRDVLPTGDVRTLLFGYGGFDVPVVPTFNPGHLTWVQRGGLLAVANLRGGGEFGAEWYEGGRLDRKQNVFDDFAACARWLAGSGWSRPERIAVTGGSNGGLLVGALLTQHPELVGAAVPEVGVFDLLRFHRFTIGWAWTSDYGDPEDPEQYRWVRAYSPLHHVRPGTAYPPTLIMTGDHDDRVVPGHSFKFAATLQAAQAGSAPILIRVETSAGHGIGKPTSKVIEERTDMLAFCEAALLGALPD